MTIKSCIQRAVFSLFRVPAPCDTFCFFWCELCQTASKQVMTAVNNGPLGLTEMARDLVCKCTRKATRKISALHPSTKQKFRIKLADESPPLIVGPWHKRLTNDPKVCTSL